MKISFTFYGVVPAMIVLLVLTGSRDAAAQPYTVHVSAPSAGREAADDDSKGRQDSVVDVRNALNDRKYRQLFTMAESEDDADLLLEVVWRGAVETDQTVTITPVGPGRSAPLGSRTRVLQDNLRLKLTAGPLEREFWALEPGKTNWMGNVPRLFWRDLAKEAVERFAAWARENEQRLQLLTRRRGR